MADVDAIVNALRQSPVLQHELGDVLDLGMLTVDGELVVRSWNRWLEAASGRAARDVIGRSLLDLYPELSGTHVESAFRRAAAGSPVVLSQRFHQYVLPFPSAGASGFTRMQQSAQLLPLHDEQRRVTGVLAIVQDVTDRVAREEELRDALEAAQSASRAKSEFLASMSHELRTPLAAMVGYADLLIDEMVGPTTPLQQDHLGRLKSCAFHLLGIVEEILTFARAESGREEIHSETLDAVQLTRGALAIVEPQLRAKHLDLVVKLPDAPVEVATDPGKLRQILVNLLGNAVKFTREGSVTVSLFDLGPQLQFTVADTGPGIAAEDLGRIFEPFTQLEQSWNRANGGTGLGLPVSRRLAHLLGGDVTVSSERGIGSSFTLVLPTNLPATVLGTAPSAASPDSQVHA